MKAEYFVKIDWSFQKTARGAHGLWEMRVAPEGLYVYWHEMRSGRCNDGSTTRGCAGDQGSDYHYGNTFRPTEQVAFPRDAWFCVEMAAQANAVGKSDGSLSLWVNDALVGEAHRLRQVAGRQATRGRRSALR